MPITTAEQSNIPQSLRTLPQWVVRRGKIPINPLTGQGAKAGQPDTWASFPQAMEQSGSYDGIGFEFHNNEITGVDLDTVRDPATGEVDPQAKEIIKKLNSYTEISPSGYGFHVYCRAKGLALKWNKMPLKPNGIKRPDIDPKTNQQKKNKDGSLKFKEPEIEMYQAGRYFTVTGNRYGQAVELEARTEELQAIQESLRLPALEPATPNVFDSPGLSQICLKPRDTCAPLQGNSAPDLATGLEKDKLLKSLWEGLGRTGDESRDDLALMNKLAYWCNCDEGKMTAAFLDSPYYRSKDAQHLKKAQRKDYLSRTVKKALEGSHQTAEQDNRNYAYSVKVEGNQKQSSPATAGAQPAETSPYDDLFEKTNYLYRWGWLHRTYRKGDETLEQYLANYIIIAESETVRDNGIDCERVFQLKAVCEGRELHSASIPAKDFSSMNFITQTWGLSLRRAVGYNVLDYIKDSISAQAKNIKQEYIYTHTGWRKCNGEWAFLHAGGAIGAKGTTGGQGVRVELDGRLSKYDLSEISEAAGLPKEENHDLQLTLDLFKVAPKELMIPLVAMAFLSPLNEFMRQVGAEPSFILYLLGTTGTMKSTLAALILCFFGRFDNKSLPESFKDTTNSLEKQGFLLKDVLTVVDDYHPTGSRREAQKMQATAQDVARMYGDRTGRGRMNADTHLRQSYIPRGNAIITGEDLPDIGQSGIARNIVLTVEKGAINVAAMTRAQEQTEALTSCMASYIRWLIPQADSLPAMLKEQFTALRKEATAASRHGRTAESVAHLQVGTLTFAQFMLEQGAISGEQAEKMQQESWNILLEIAEKQGTQLEQEKPTTLFMTAFHELLETGVIHVMEVDTPTTDAYTHSDGFVGYEDRDYYYLYADTAFTAVVQFYRAQDKNFPVKKNALLKQLATEGLAEPDLESGRNVKQKKIGGKKAKYLWLHRPPENIL